MFSLKIKKRSNRQWLNVFNPEEIYTVEMHDHITRTVGPKERQQIPFPGTHIPQLAINFGRAFPSLFNLSDLQYESFVDAVPIKLMSK